MLTPREYEQIESAIQAMIGYYITESGKDDRLKYVPQKLVMGLLKAFTDHEQPVPVRGC